MAAQQHVAACYAATTVGTQTISRKLQCRGPQSPRPGLTLSNTLRSRGCCCSSRRLYRTGCNDSAYAAVLAAAFGVSIPTHKEARWGPDVELTPHSRPLPNKGQQAPLTRLAQRTTSYSAMFPCSVIGIPLVATACTCCACSAWSAWARAWSAGRVTGTRRRISKRPPSA